MSPLRQGDLIAATWRVADPGPNSDIFVNVSTDGGLTWLPAPLRLDQDAAGAGESAGPNIAVEGQSIAVVWQDDFPTGPDRLKGKYDEKNTPLVREVKAGATIDIDVAKDKS